MISFDNFVARSGINLPSYFFANNITSDEGLREYCLANGFIPPEKSYFVVEEKVPDPVAEVEEAKKELAKEEPELKEKPAPKKAEPKKRTRTTRRRSTRTTKNSKTSK